MKRKEILKGIFNCIVGWIIFFAVVALIQAIFNPSPCITDF